MYILAIVGVLLLIAVLSSTRHGRAEARERMAKYNPIFWAFSIILWGLLIGGMIFK
ncbi:MAG: hypothetical protein ACKOPQ_10315 [Novosphingobium sp.]